MSECHQLQSKGGDGNITRIPKTDPKHLSNDIQVKMNMRNFIRMGDIALFVSDEI